MNYYLTLASILAVYMTLWFVVSIVKKRNDLADVAWGLGFVLMAWSSLALSGNFGLRSLVACVLVTIWGLRLAIHIYKRNKGRGEDYRYQAWRNAWGKLFYLRSFLQIYILQGFLLFVIAVPVTMINSSLPTHHGWFDLFGVLIWLFGFGFESIGDAQLAAFLRNPENKGKILQTGLWAYSRHPNYFGEVTQWWGLWVVAMNAPQNWISIIGPMTITFLILKVSGVPLLEKKMTENPEFAAYKQRVSMFIPWWPKKT